MGAQWPTGDEATLIEFLVVCKAEAGDGFNFKGVTWQAAAVHMVAATEKGDPKTASVCKNKWAQMCASDLPFLSVLTTTYS